MPNILPLMVLAAIAQILPLMVRGSGPNCPPGWPRASKVNWRKASALKLLFSPVWHYRGIPEFLCLGDKLCNRCRCHAILGCRGNYHLVTLTCYNFNNFNKYFLPSSGVDQASDPLILSNSALQWTLWWELAVWVTRPQVLIIKFTDVQLQALSGRLRGCCAQHPLLTKTAVELHFRMLYHLTGRPTARCWKLNNECFFLFTWKVTKTTCKQNVGHVK